MANTTFSGPIKAGTIKNTTGTTVGTDVKNVGFVNISVGTSSTSTELFTALAAGTAANVILHGSDGTVTDADTWVDIGTSDLPIYIDFSAGTSGVGYITVEYIQNINNA